MSVSIIVERRSEGASPISLAEWQAIISRDKALRLSREASVAINPATGERIQLNAGDGQTEIHVGGEWRPFLRWQRGVLTIRYSAEYEAASNPTRAKIAAVAQALGAVVGSDAGDDLLQW